MPDPFTPREDRETLKASLLEALPLCASTSEALALVELPSGTYHRWRQADPEWAAQVDAAIAQRDAQQALEPATGDVGTGSEPSPIVSAPDTQHAVELLWQRLDAMDARLTVLEDARETLRTLGTAWCACAANLRTMRGLQHLARTTEGSSRGPLTDLMRVLGELGSTGPEAA